MKKNTIVFWGQYPGNFETKFFPLRFEGILYNSVAMSLNTVGVFDINEMSHFSTKPFLIIILTFWLWIYLVLQVFMMRELILRMVYFLKIPCLWRINKKGATLKVTKELLIT